MKAIIKTLWSFGRSECSRVKRERSSTMTCTKVSPGLASIQCSISKFSNMNLNINRIGCIAVMACCRTSVARTPLETMKICSRQG